MARPSQYRSRPRRNNDFGRSAYKRPLHQRVLRLSVVMLAGITGFGIAVNMVAKHYHKQVATAILPLFGNNAGFENGATPERLPFIISGGLTIVKVGQTYRDGDPLHPQGCFPSYGVFNSRLKDDQLVIRDVSDHEYELKVQPGDTVDKRQLLWVLNKADRAEARATNRRPMGPFMDTTCSELVLGS